MNLAALSFRDLEYVVAVADRLHFGKAAIACAVSQPTLSAQIRKLEEYFGFDLFERTGRSILLTERGAEMVAQARIILNEGRRLYEIARSGAEPLSGIFRLGMIATLGPYVTPLLLRPVRERFPQLKLILSEGLTHHLVPLLASGELDAVLASPPVSGPDLVELPLFHEDLVLAVPRDHPLATSPLVQFADLEPDQLILLNEGHCLRDQTLALYPGHEGQPSVNGRQQAASLESMRQMVGAGMGCALLPRLAVQVGALLDDMVAYRVVRGVPLQRTISMFHRASFPRIRDARLLRDLIRDTMETAGTVTVHGRSTARPEGG